MVASRSSAVHGPANVASVRAGWKRVDPSFRVLPTALVPPAEEDFPPPETGFIPRPVSSEQVLQHAGTLGIPWERILLEEIETELKLRRYLPELDRRFPLSRAADILSFSLLRSWRVRDRIETLACEARTTSPRGALRLLRIVFRRLTGKEERSKEDVSGNLWFAYQRVLLLQRARRVAARTRGPMPDRLAAVCTLARCGYDDATWAVSQEDSPRRGFRLEAAVQKVRNEGFRIPRAESEARAVTELRRMLHRRRPRVRATRPLSAPPRVRLPLDAF
jgi:hypothetical protein